MSLRNFTNSTTIGALTAPVASSATTLTVTGFSGYPAVPFTATVDRNTATEEIVLVTAVAAGTLTVTRGFDGTAAQAHSAGAAVEHTVGAIEFIEANAHINATTGVHGSSGALVSTSATQTLMNKTLISPVAQADATLGDAVVAYVPTAAGAKNLFRGIAPSGADVITVDSGGNVNAQTLASTGATNVHGALTVTGTSTLTGAATLAGGATVPTGQKVTLTDAPVATTDASNKSYVDGKTWPSTKISDAASAATASVVVKRDAAGRAQFVDPSAAQDAATKHYVDAVSAQFQWGKVAANISGSASFSSGSVSFPTAFPNPPIVMLTAESDTAGVDLVSGLIATPSTTGFSWRIRERSASNGPYTANLNWLALAT